MTIAAILSTKGGEVATVPAGTRVRDAVAIAQGTQDRRRAGGRRRRRSSASSPNATWSAASARMAPRRSTWPVDAGMSSPALTVDSDTPVLAALSIMTKRRIRHLPVVESGEIRGIVSIGDLVKHRIERIEAEAEALRSYIQTA